MQVRIGEEGVLLDSNGTFRGELRINIGDVVGELDFSGYFNDGDKSYWLSEKVFVPSGSVTGSTVEDGGERASFLGQLIYLVLGLGVVGLGIWYIAKNRSGKKHIHSFPK